MPNGGVHELKGKAEPVPLFRALRVTAGRAGALKAEGLEAPFVGRERELRLVKELFHAAAEETKANLVSVVGIAGIGKSRLSWEFEKYIDGLAGDIWWHRGRCLSYGGGRGVLGSRGDGTDALRDRRRRGAGLSARKAASDDRGAHPRSRGASLGRATACSPTRSRRGHSRRPGEPLLGLADPLRAARGA